MNYTLQTTHYHYTLHTTHFQQHTPHYTLRTLHTFNHTLKKSNFKHRIILNGMLVYEGLNYQGDHEEIDTNFHIMGNNQRIRGNYTHSLFGRMSDVNIWNRTFSQQEIASWEQCHMESGGNIFNYSPINIRNY